MGTIEGYQREISARWHDAVAALARRKSLDMAQKYAPLKLQITAPRVTFKAQLWKFSCSPA